ncbi:MAG: hypothetical protein RL563_2649 [Pseudomonadota bacterium]|jgi:hypothetical protein
MNYLSLMDLCEEHGFKRVYAACCAATRGDCTALAQLGIIGADTESAHGLCQIIERAWFCDFLNIAARAIDRAKGIKV